jgi:hypothetical protein
MKLICCPLDLAVSVCAQHKILLPLVLPATSRTVFAMAWSILFCVDHDMLQTLLPHTGFRRNCEGAQTIWPAMDNLFDRGICFHCQF